jgi:hypothetical protein
MTAHLYPDELPIPVARARYFVDNGFGEDGGYQAKFVDLKLGPITIPFPNTKGRAKAVRYHDLHHLITGYATDFPSEMEISAWEVGAGCGRSAAAWLIDLSALGTGLLAYPKRTLRAFWRGRRSESLFDEPFEPLMGRTVGELRRQTRIPAPDEAIKPRASDVLALAGAALGALAAAPVVVAGTLALMPFGLLARA